MKTAFLSKSRYLNGLQCPRLLWISSNQPERMSQPDAATQYIFDQGQQVGELARQVFPGGIEVPVGNFRENMLRSRSLLQERKPLFEAGFMAGNTFARADILKPVADNAWDIIEVKSSTSVKKVNVHDVAFQRYCYEQSGLEIRRCFLMYINNQDIRNGDIEPEQLFTTEDITGAVNEVYSEVPRRVSEMLAVVRSEECPGMAIGPHCNAPYACPVTECWEGLPENHVFTLYYGGKKAFDLYNGGIMDINDIPPDFSLNDKQLIQHNCVIHGMPYIDKNAIRHFLAGLKYPLYFLDFETFGTAIPLFNGTRPYQNIPFQFSLHVMEEPCGETVHYEYLAGGRYDPRLELLMSLNRLIGESGSIVAYNKSFEERVLLGLGNACPEYTGWTAGIIPRFIDLLLPFRSFYYYHPSQKGSASLKSVLPAITGQGYEGMAIARGDDASLAFLEITFKEVAADGAARVREELLTYCKMDTEGMIMILKKLNELSV